MVYSPYKKNSQKPGTSANRSGVGCPAKHFCFNSNRNEPEHQAVPVMLRFLSLNYSTYNILVSDLEPKVEPKPTERVKIKINKGKKLQQNKAKQHETQRKQSSHPKLSVSVQPKLRN